jgi:hypothetical protein
MSLSVKSLKLLGCLIELYLCRLSLGNLLLELLRLTGDLNSQFLNIKGEFLDFGLVSTAILLEGEVILLLLSGGKGPLLKLLLVPVHLKLELIHLLISLEDHVLDVVQAVLLISYTLLQLLNLILEPAALSLSHLFQVLLTFDLLVLDIYE